MNSWRLLRTYDDLVLVRGELAPDEYRLDGLVLVELRNGYQIYCLPRDLCDVVWTPERVYQAAEWVLEQ